MTAIEIVGHRGAAGEAPENTLAGFTHARAIGLTGVEFDVRLSRDHELVVIHDSTVDRTTDQTGAVNDYTAAELATLDARGTCPDWPEPVGIPTLAEALNVIASFRTIQFEIKSDSPDRLERITEGIIREIRNRSIEHQSIVTSFDPLAIEIVQRLAPEQARAYIGRPDDHDIVATSLRLGCSQANLHQYRSTAAQLVQELHDAGLRVGGGPCDTTEDLDVALAWGMDTVTSDHPTLLLEHLRSR